MWKNAEWYKIKIFGLTSIRNLQKKKQPKNKCKILIKKSQQSGWLEIKKNLNVIKLNFLGWHIFEICKKKQPKNKLKI